MSESAMKGRQRRIAMMQLLLFVILVAVVCLLPTSTAVHLHKAFFRRKRPAFVSNHSLHAIRGGSIPDHEQQEEYNHDDEVLYSHEKDYQNDHALVAQEEEQEHLLDASVVLSAEIQELHADNDNDINNMSLKRRRTSELILNLIDQSSGTTPDDELSARLRQLTMERRDELLDELACRQNVDKQPKSMEDHHHAVGAALKRLLHVLAPKIPAIRQSPDVALAIRALPSDMDAGVAASMVATLAHLWELHNQQHGYHSSGASSTSSYNATVLVASELVHDRRFEQLMETIVCGVDVSKRKEEALALDIQRDNSNSEDDLVHLIQHSQVSEGLSIRDSCRAAWGIAMLGVHDVDMIGETKVHDLLVALSLRTRELLLARVRLLCQDDFYVETNSTMPVEERIVEIAKEIAEDTATAMWVFGCVQAVTGIVSAPLLHVCTSILCHDPFQIRKDVQEAIATLDEPIVGGSDVIEKLDRAERTEDVVESPVEKQNQDVFLDWLSPTEVTDVLWSLAVYASKDSESMDSITVLSDIAIDRVLEWVASDLEQVAFAKDAEIPDESHIPIDGVEHYAEGVQQVSEDASMDLIDNTECSPDVEKEFHYLEVVDAAEMLASEYTQDEYTAESINGNEDYNAESTVSSVNPEVSTIENLQAVDAAAILEAEEALEPDSLESNDAQSDPVQIYLSKQDEIEWLFSAHDLCSLSWAATELRDSLKSRTTQMVSDLLVRMGPKHLASCSSADLSNLIWAIAKESGEKPSESTGNFVTLGRWIAQNVFDTSGLADAVIESDSWTLLGQFQPPELSRLLWSLASLSITAEDEDLSRLVGVLSLAGLETASRNFHLFSTEDLARICWAFVEFSDHEAVLKTNPSSLQSLGRVLGVIDICLLNWEAGHLSTPAASKDEDETEHVKESFRFTSFFGRGRSHISKLERKIEELAEDIDDYPVPSLLTEKAKLPFLKDFPVDPATLCKLCGSLSRPETAYSEICDARSMAKVIIRLMTSRNGRLLRECHINDFASLCATAVSVTSSTNRELISLFARRAVNVLNRKPSMLELATPSILVKLLCALSDLGAKYDPQGDAENAHRRLHLTSKLPNPDAFALESLSDDSLQCLTRGLAVMNATSSENDLVSETLGVLNSRFPTIKHSVRLDDILSIVVKFRPSSSQLSGNHTDANTTLDANDGSTDGDSTEQKIIRYTTSLLHQIADEAVEQINEIEAFELRKILHHFVALPFPVDDLVLAAQEEVDRRLAVTNKSAQAACKLTESLEQVPRDILKQLAESARGHPSKKAQKILRSIVRDPKEKRKDEQSGDVSEDMHPTLDDILEIICAAAEVRDSQVDFPTDKSDRVEYGRIQELISQYHRIDFESGTRQSRFNNEGQRLMAKRMMSRLLP